MNRSPNPAVAKIIFIIIGIMIVASIGYRVLGGTPTKTSHTPVKTSQKVAKDTSSTPVKPAKHIDAELQQIVDDWAAQQAFSTSVIVQELDGQLRGAEHVPDTLMTTASTYKLYVSYAVLHEIEQGTYTLQTTTRTGQTVNAALSKMILDSDNTSAEALGFLVGWDHVNNLAAAVGAISTDINNYNSAGQPVNGNKTSTSHDLTLLITKLQQGTLLNKTHTDLLLGLMKNQHWRERVPNGVPTNIAVADKPGWLGNVQNDAAVVYGPKSTYTIVILTGGSSTQPLADLSKFVYDYLQK